MDFDPNRPPLFDGGRVITTAAIANLILYADLNTAPYLQRHFRGEWGDIDDSLRFDNDTALRTEGRLVSLHHVTSRLRLAIVTSTDRSTTTIMLAQEF